MSKKRAYQTYKKEPSVQDLDKAHPANKILAGLPPTDVTTKIVYNENHSSYPPPLPQLPPHLAKAPFRHASTSDLRKSEAILDYEHLEFLGDAYLETIATRLIFTRFPELKVGRQSAFREKLVRNKTLAGFARMYGFDKRIQAIGIETATEKAKDKVLGDMIEVSPLNSQLHGAQRSLSRWGILLPSLQICWSIHYAGASTTQEHHLVLEQIY